MSSKILIITSSFDLTSDYIISKYDKIDFMRLNVDHFHKYNFLINQDDINIWSTNWNCKLSTLDAIYYRKPSLPNLSDVFEEKFHSYAHKEIFSLIEGVVESFNGRCLTKPSILRVGNNKIVQCLMARKVGFKMPASRITNSKKLIKAEKTQFNIVKPISIGTIYRNNSQLTVQTNIVNDYFPMDTLEYCPAYFQDFINKDYDLRITFVGDEFFPVKINSSDRVDWRRKNNNVTYEIYSPPNILISQCKDMLSILNLEFGCFDFVVKDGEYFFLEVNANGQWGWLEQELGVDISGAILKHLKC